MIGGMKLEKLNQAKAIIDKYFQDLSMVEKPKASQIGGTYYGSTQLMSSVGNHLDIVTGDYVSYCYGTNIYYKDVYALRVGGAYKFSFSNIVKELKSILEGQTDWKLIDNYGTNFSVVGIGQIRR